MLDLYAQNAPSIQQTLDIFKGTWSSRVPLPATTGKSNLFNDPRVTGVDDRFGFKGKKILELGPLEGAHSYMMHERGAESITCIEGNSQSLLKCLLVKEMFGLSRAKFVYADMLSYLQETDERYDLIFACGVLYHMRQPLELLRQLKMHTNAIFVHTAFFREEVLRGYYGSKLETRFEQPIEISCDGFTCMGHPHFYREAVDDPIYCGGNAPTSMWLESDDIVNFIKHIGFNNVEVYELDLTVGFAPRYSIFATV